MFNAIKDQLWVRRLTRPLSQNPKRPDLGITAPSKTRWVIPQLSVGPSDDTSKIWLIMNIFESSSSIRDNLRRLKYKGKTHHKTIRQIAPSSS